MPNPRTDTPPSEVLAARLRRLREARNLTQEDVATHLGLKHRVQVHFIESGQRRVLATEAVALARLYKVPVGRLLGGL